MQINLRTLTISLVLTGLICAPASGATDAATDTLLRGAKKWVDRDRSDLAKDLLKKLILIEPNSPEALLMLGRIAIKNGKPEEARGYLRTLEQTAPEGRHTRELKEAIEGPPLQIATPAAEPKRVEKPIIAAGKPAITKPAIAAVKPGTTKPKIAAIRTEKRRTATTANKPEKSKQDEAASLASDPDIIARTDALDALEDGNLELAQSSLMDIVTRRPHDPEVLGGLGLIKQRQGKFADAEEWFRKAMAASKGENPKWISLASLAEFWKTLRISSKLFEENKLDEAEIAIQKALALQADEPNALTLLGDIKAAQNDLVGAERIYREVLAKQNDNVSATRALSNLLSRTQRSEEALTLVESVLQQLPPGTNPENKAGLLREAAGLYSAAHQSSRAMQALETAVQLAPKEAWSRFSLAKLYISLDLAPLGRKVVEEGVNLSPADPSMRYVHGLILLSLDDYSAAISTMDQIPDGELTDAMLETRNRALMQYYFQQAQASLKEGNRREAIRIMSVAETAARGNYAATEQVAEGWFKLGLQKAGISAMRKLPQPAPLDTQIYWASLLNRAKMDQELTDFLPSLRLPEGQDEAAVKRRERVLEIEFAMAGRHYDKLLKAKKTEQAQQFADSIFDAHPLSTSEYFRLHRSYFSGAALTENATELLTQEKDQFPNDLSLRYDLAYAYYQNKQTSNAKREIDALLAITPADDIDMRLRIASLQQNVGDDSGARQTVHDLTTRFPNNTEALFQAGNIARSHGNYDQAMRYYQQIKDMAPQTAESGQKEAPETPQSNVLLNLLPDEAAKPAKKPRIHLVGNSESEAVFRASLASDIGNKEKPAASGIASSVDQAMESISSRRTGEIETGIDIQSKTASNGTSTYQATEIPLVASFPIGYEAQGKLQIDKVDVDAGVLASAFADAALFGKIQAVQAVPPQPLTPRASGTSLGLGYERSSLKADIGISGQGFPVSNVVGGVRTGGDIGRLSYSLTLSRRAYTGSLLSYAGAIDPVSGTTWGGVTNTGLMLYVSSTLGDYNLSGLSNYGLLRGQNVQNNDRLYLRAAVDRDVYSSDDTLLNVGLGVNYTSFSKNQAFYTFGHGGYYSPQSSLSFNLPIELSGRADLLNYQLRANVSYARSKEDNAPFYPTDAALQARAAAGPNFPPGNNLAIYKGGVGSGFGYGLRGSTEYRVTPEFVLGGRFSMERSAYYAPNSVLMYLKYMFNPETGPVKLKPDPVTPYSQY